MWINVERNGGEVNVTAHQTIIYENSFNDNSTKNSSGGCAIAGMIGFLVLVGGVVTVIVSVLSMIVQSLT